ncbi:uncharacterized protein LOC112341985 [Selaginella moellendorffii]|uniref:uncharacterized protein LOC112341985 n=1 Tax=Selaginella moellendorffii TaxID=88036 RepID=UPI000D1CB505|nr:uncharacterized protein LOC112341985 [Selaginella moellendorffii]|eukprot:XP_024518829.1 uncharacterized protein LOC112341985 [Selaginella moellendorffii]
MGSLDFRAFILRSRAIAVYRSGLRLTKRAPSSSRDELKNTIRAEMEKNRAVTDPAAIRYLISDGLQRIKELQTMLSIQGND